MYGCTSWALTKDMLQALRRTQRPMRRLIVHTPRRRSDDETHLDDGSKADTSSADSIQRPDFDDGDDEDVLELWEGFIRRATHIATDSGKRACMDEWATIYFRRKRRYDG